MNKNAPLIVQGDGTILLDVSTKHFEEIRNFMLVFAELVKSPEYIHTYRITLVSLWNAASLNYTSEQILSFLKKYTSYEIPKNIVKQIETSIEKYGRIKIIKEDDKYYLISEDKNIIDEILHYKLMIKYIKSQINPNKLEIDATYRGHIKLALINIGYPVQDLAGYKTGEEYHFHMRDKLASSGDDFALRDYQRNSVDAFYADGKPEGGAGVIALPCGTGKTVVGIAAMHKTQTKTLIIVTGVTACRQWRDEILDKTDIPPEDIGEYNGLNKEIKPITIATYKILTYRKNKESPFVHFELFFQHNWGLIIYDEVHLLPAPIIKLTSEIQSMRRLGLTATLVREDGLEKDVFCLIGPKKFDIPWRELEEKKFIRVGTTLYKIVRQPNIRGGHTVKRIVWNNETLRQDYGKDFIATVPKYDGFCTVPDHVNYQPVIDNFLNLYEPIGHKPEEGDFPGITSLMRHIFAEQYELGMDYLQLLYLRPVQKLPILLLVSEERNTGKSTFLNFLKAVFRDNVTFNTNEDFRSQFNSDWAGKLMILVDEVLLNRREDSERLKNLSTTLSYKVEAKGRDRDEIAFFAKFVLCSNNENLPVIIDPGETRYWVRKVGRLENDDTEFLPKLKAEIPALLYHLQHRRMATEQSSRMWFDPGQIATPALRKIIRSNRNILEIEMSELILEIMDIEKTDRFSFCINDMTALLQLNQTKADKHSVRKVVCDQWKLSPAPNGLTYTTCQFDTSIGQYFPVKRVGRFYTVTKEFLEKLQ